MDDRIVKRIIAASLLGRDRSKDLNVRLRLFQREFSDIYQTDAVHAFWSDLLMEIDLGRDIDEKLEIPFNVPNTKDESQLTIREYLTSFGLRAFMTKPFPLKREFPNE